LSDHRADHPAQTGQVLVRLARAALLALLLGVVLWAAVLDFLPPTGRDALIHHLAVPKIWLKAGGAVEIPWAAFSYYPMNLDILYLLPLTLNADWGAAIIHHLFGLLTALLIFLYLRKRLGLDWALLGGLLFLSTPIIMRLATLAYVDLGLIFFITGAWMGLVEWASTGAKRFFIMSALALGLALGTKYNALIAPVFLVPAVLVIRSRAGDGFARCVLWGAAYSILALAVFSPWMIRNFHLTGNPLYPLYNGLWGLPSVNPAGTRIDIFTRRSFLFGESVLDVLLVPLRAFFTGQDNSPRFFDGVLNPALILFPLAAVIKPRERGVRLLALFALIWMYVVLFQSSFRIRYMAPVIPVLVVLTVFGLYEFRSFLLRRMSFRLSAAGFTAVVCVFLYLNAAWAFRHWGEVDPVPYLRGREGRSEYLTRKLAYYPAMEYINRRLPLDSNILFLFAGDQGYYSDRDYFFHTYYSGESIRPILLKAGSAGEVRAALRQGSDRMPGATHILIRPDLLGDYLINNFQPDRLRIWSDFANKYLELLYRESGYTLSRIR